ncbi:LysR substrate-binding domain-containing protein [Paraburkholderia acidisoli]|uniref:LysR family transcriptional regulator n=1 Tax=Paraburkholderia acidisoli TaxID=2571748 RepID=A0A7Z2GQN0_9BURK|nr:LysR substrate-binding domain-containing protein [Paraburkholderia acidisoli]QGZ66102.1 LysR family transcriptional regulator [Paraburkholderia acidisoli]
MPVSLAQLASLDQIRGFVAVGRRMSITLAADDLCLTQSAVSRQIAALEDALGLRLFQRGYRSIAFTPEGERLFRTADSAVQQLQEALDVLRQGTLRRPVTITASIGVSALWLLPRLGALQQRHPAIDLRVAATDKVLDLRAEGVDLAIRYASLRGAAASSLRLFDEAIVPVAHPSLRVARLDAATLARSVLIEFDGPRRPLLRWTDYLSACGLASPPPRGMLRFNQYDQVIQAALAGRGIALGRRPLIAPMLADGRLAVIGKNTAPRASGHAYFLDQAEDVPRAEVHAVIEWIGQASRAMT